MGEGDYFNSLPPRGSLYYIYEALLQIGIVDLQVGASGGFYTPIKFAEIRAWPYSARLLPCEIQTIRDLSVTYANHLNGGSDMPEPWSR